MSDFSPVLPPLSHFEHAPYWRRLCLADYGQTRWKIWKCGETPLQSGMADVKDADSNDRPTLRVLNGTRFPSSVESIQSWINV